MFMCDFLFLRIRHFLAIMTTKGFSRPQTPDFQKIKSHFVISTDSKSPAIKCFKTGLIYPYKLP